MQTAVLSAALVIACAMASDGRPRAQVPQTSALSDQVAIGANVYFPDGRSVSAWSLLRNGKLDPSHGQHFSVETLCAFETNASRFDTQSGYGWRFDATVVRELKGAPENGVMVRIDWRRSRHRMQNTDSPNGSVVLTLTPGKSVPLDYIVPNPEDAKKCSAVGMLLDVSLWHERPKGGN